MEGRDRQNSTQDKHTRIRNVITKIIVLFFVCSFVFGQPMATVVRADDADGGAQQIEQSTEADTTGDSGSDTVDTGEEPSGSGESITDPEAEEPTALPEETNEEAPTEPSEDAEPEESEPTREGGLPSGEIENGWIWKLTGEGDNLTMEFEYTGDADPKPELRVPDDFIANISEALGENKNSIQSVVFPEETTRVGNKAFQNLSSLKTADFSALHDIDVTYSPSAAPKPSFALGNYAFDGCDLSSVDLPDQTNWLGNYAFRNNKNLKTASLPSPSYMALGSTTGEGQQLFSGCSSLEEATFRIVEGRNQYSNRNTLPSGAFQGCSSLRKLDLSGYKNQTNGNLTLNNIFLNNDCSALEELILPQDPLRKATIQEAAFINKKGLSDLSVIKNPQNINTMTQNAFNGSGIQHADMTDWTSLTTINERTFANCLQLQDAVIPTNVTTIGKCAFGNDPQLTTVTVRASQLTNVDPTLFDGSGKLETVTIGKEVKKLDGDFLIAVPESCDLLFEGENIIEITKPSVSGGNHPLKELNGTYYVDPQGVLYQLDSDGTATVAYIPPRLTSYTVPATIDTPNGSFTVDRVASHFCNLADELTALNFENPSQVKIPAMAFTGWRDTNSEDAAGNTINGETVIKPSEWAGVSILCDYPIDETEEPNKPQLVPSIQSMIKDAGGNETLRTIIAINGKEKSDDDTYDYKTGEKASYTIAISNKDNTILNKIVRVYFAYDNDGYHMGSFPVGEFNVVIPGGNSYPVLVKETDTPGIYYYEITGIVPGETLAFQNDVFYPSPDTPGGGLRIWTETLTPEEAAAHDATVDNPTDYMQLDWDTDPVVYDLNKSFSKVYNTTEGKAVAARLKSTSNGDVFVTHLAFRIKETNQGSSDVSEGVDYIRWVQYSDILETPDGAEWDPAVIAAIKAGQKSSSDSADGWYISNGTTYIDSNTTRSCKVVNVTANGSTKELAYLYCFTEDYSYILGLTPSVVRDSTGKDQVRLDWYMNNRTLSGSSGQTEYQTHEFYLRYGDSVLLADVETVNEIMQTTDEDGNPNLLTLHNTADEIRHYSYSPDQQSDAAANAPVTADAGLESLKAHEGNNGWYVDHKGGTEDYMYVSMTNTGILDLNTWGSPKKDKEGNEYYDGKMITDDLNAYYYIQDQDLAEMLNATAKAGTGDNEQECPVGDWLTITINNVSLFTMDQYQPAQGTAQNNKYTSDSTSNISASADTGARVYQQAKMVLRKNREENCIEITLSGDPMEVNNRTYRIGEGEERDYPDITAFFNAIGYMPTNGTTYSLEWSPENFTLRAGQEIRFRILSTYKTTPMRLTSDNRYYHPESYGYVSNTAKVMGKVGETIYNKSLTAPTHYWRRELYLYKEGFIEGSSSSITGESVMLKDGTVIDAHVYGYNESGKAYDKMSMHDYMTGAQVLLVPKAQNPTLTDNDGGQLETYSSGGVEYWLLNKPGTYTDVVLGSTGKNGTQTYETSTIIISKTSGSLNTEIHWKEFNNWGGSSTRTNIWYKSLVSAEKSGLLEPGSEAATSYTINNKAWLGDHQGHRLYDYMGKVFQVFSFSKYIVTDEGRKDGTDTVSDGTLVGYSRLKNGKTVTYQIDISNTSSSITQLSGNRIRDRLPATFGTFDWTRGDVESGIEANVENLRYYVSDGVTITLGQGEDQIQLSGNGEIDPEHDAYWRVVKNTDGTFDIKWDNDFVVHFPNSGKITILVDITFPERPESGSSPWDQYLAATKGNMVYNYFYLDGRESHVMHSLEAEGKPVLYKGVYDTGLTTRRSGSSSSSSCTYTSDNTRLMYSNGPDTNSYSSQDLKAQTITYYTVLYNGSYDRLYLSDLQDELPLGFKFNGFCNYTDGTTSVYSNSNTKRVGFSGNKEYYGAASDNYRCVYTEAPQNSSYNLVKISNANDEYDNNTIRYVNARVQVVTSNGEGGKEHLTFKFVGTGSDSTSYPSLKWDETVQKYYLNPGEAVRINYNCEIASYAKTEDLATNTVAMPYYDYYGIGFNLHVPDEDGNGGAVQTVTPKSGIKVNNDGGCETMTAEEVKNKYHFDTAPYTDERYNNGDKGNWLVSDVTVERAPIVPGIQKAVGGLTTRITNPTPTSIEGSKGSDASLYGSKYGGGCKTVDVVNWRVRVFNEEGTGDENTVGTMQNYVVTDTMAQDYSFTGQVFYNMYRASSASGSRVTYSSQYLFTLGSRTAGDTSVKIGTGSSVGNTDLVIGSAEDDSDDNWFSFGTGVQAGKVKLERTADKKEVLTIVLEGSRYSIPGGCWADFCVHTIYDDPLAIVVSEGKYNDVIVTPEQDYDPERVAQGKARRKQVQTDDGRFIDVNDGVESGASIILTQGYNTESWKKITETGNSSNTARSDEATNYINLDEKCKTFRYDLYTVGPQAVMGKFVLIDDLPQEGDHSSFVDEDKRNSDFTVGFLADDPEFEVTLAKSKGGTEIPLSPLQYRLAVNTKTEFNDKDWEGEGSGWIDVTFMSGAQLKEVLETARSVRLIIEDPNAYQTEDKTKYLMSNQSQIKLSFNAKIDDEEAEPGEYAWNSFGYTYNVTLVFGGTQENSGEIGLQAQPLNVGIRYPAAPQITKTLTEEVTQEIPVIDKETGEPLIDEETEEPVTETVTSIVPHEALDDITFGFLVYEGEPISELNDVSGMLNDEIDDILRDKERKYIYVPLEIAAGSSEAMKGLWTYDYAYKYDKDSDSFEEDKRSAWHWQNESNYTILELPMGDFNYEQIQLQINKEIYTDNNQGFENSNKTRIRITVENRYVPEYTDVSVVKVWDDKNNIDKVRPASILVHLLKNGEEIDEQELSAENGWSFTWEQLLLEEEDGTTYIYEVTEDPVEKYTTTITSEEDDPYTITITNSYTPIPPKDEPPTPSDGIDTGDHTHTLPYILMMAGAGAVLLAALLIRSRRRKKR